MTQKQSGFNVWRYVSLGWIIVVCLLVGLGLGLWLDSVLPLRPLFTIAGIVLGTIAAFATMIRVLVATGD